MLEGMIKSELNIINADTGSVMHALKKTDPGFQEFGEVYFSTVKKDAVKAWKLHQHMTLNLIVPVGSVLFYFMDVRDKSNTLNETCKIILSQDPYFRLTVPPGIWFGFKGISKQESIILNLTNIHFQKKEIKRCDKNKIKFNW